MEDDKEFWKELMGNDFNVDEFLPEEKENNEIPDDLGFTVEYTNNETGEEPGKTNTDPVNSPTPEDFFKNYLPNTNNQNNVGKSVPEDNIIPNEQFQKNITPGEKKKTAKPSQKETKASDNFEVDFDFDNEYQDVNEKMVKRGRSKRTGCLGGIFYFLFILCISLALACFGWMCATDVLGLGSGNGTVEITLDKELFTIENVEKTDEDGNTVMTTVTTADMDEVTDILYENGLIRYKWLFKLFSKFSHADTKIKYGTYLLSENYDYRALVSGMTSSGGKKVETEITIPEGYTLSQIITLLDKERVCDSEDLWNAAANYDFDYDFLSEDTLGDAKRLEGYLFPDTYKFYVNDTPSRVLNKMLSNFNNKWTEEFDEKAEALGYSMEDIINIAAMIEKEAGGDSERATIASVIYNRLENPNAGTNGYLQIDATIYYAIEGTDKEFSTDIDSMYNTYKYPGLPAGPIANPGLSSIKAALNPEDTGYYYYALGKDGLHKFFKSYDSFINFVNSDEYGG